MKIGEKGLFYRTSRRAYVWNYVIVALLVFFFYLVFTRFGLSFSLTPRTFEQIWQTFFTLGILAAISFLIEEPVLEGVMRKYHITTNEIVKIEGLLRKKRLVVPMQNVADVSVRKSIIGRIFNFGDIDVKGFKDEFTMKGMANPEEIQKILQSKINLFRNLSLTGTPFRKHRELEVTDKK